MTDTELRDSIAKEIFISYTKQRGQQAYYSKDVAKLCFDLADEFMNEKLSRTSNLVKRNFIGDDNQK